MGCRFARRFFGLLAASSSLSQHITRFNFFLILYFFWIMYPMCSYPSYVHTIYCLMFILPRFGRSIRISRTSEFTNWNTKNGRCIYLVNKLFKFHLGRLLNQNINYYFIIMVGGWVWALLFIRTIAFTSNVKSMCLISFVNCLMHRLDLIWDATHNSWPTQNGLIWIWKGLNK